MEQDLKATLLSTLSPAANIRNSAEERLKIVGKNPEMMGIIQSVLMTDPNIRIKQVSSIFFANAVKQNWKTPEMAHFNAFLQSKIISFLIPEDHFPRQCYLNILQCIFDNAKVEEVETLAGNLSFFFESQDIATQRAGLAFVTGLVKSETLRYNLGNILAVVFGKNGPIFSQRFSEALRREDWVTGKIFMKIVARVYMYYTLPEYLNRLDVLEGFYMVSLSIMGMDISEDIEKEKMRKWAAFFLYKTSNKGYKKYFKNEAFVEFTRRDDTVNQLLKVFCSIVERKSRGQAIMQTTLVHTCEFFSLLSQTKTTKHIMKSCVSFLLNNFVLPSQSFDSGIRELFECDAEQYLMTRYNYAANHLRSSTESLFSDIIHIDKGVKAETFGNIIGFLDRRDAPNYEAYRYGVVELLAAEQKGVSRFMGVDNYKNFLINQILSDLSSPHTFLVSQALYYMAMADENPLDLTTSIGLLRKVLDIMNGGVEILSVEASLAMGFFLNKEEIRETVSQLVPALFEKVIAFSKHYLLESLNTLMDTIIENFTDVVASFAPQFAESICNNIIEHIERNEESRIATVSGLVSTLDKLVVNADGQPVIVEKIYQSVYKVIFTIFYKKIDDFYQETFDLTNSLLFTLKRVDEDLLRIFTLALSIERDDLSYYPREVNDFVDNFLSYGKGSIINNDTLEKIYGCIDLYIQSTEPEDDIYSEDFEAGCQIADSLMINTGAVVRAMNPRIIPCIVHKMVVNYEKACECGYLDVLALETIMNCFIFAPQQVIETLGPFLPKFFTEIVSKHGKFGRVHDKKVFILFMGSLFSMAAPIYGVNIEGLTGAFVSVLCSLPAAIKRRNKLKAREEEEESNEENDKEVSEDDEEEEYTDDYEVLSEDIWFETDLDKLDAFEYVRTLLAAPVPKSVGETAISKMTQDQVMMIREVLGVQQEAQK
ncbi:importin-7 [Pancytospora epiphaga]|nr:importin-7 [Pancytospora epiphaga]